MKAILCKVGKLAEVVDIENSLNGIKEAIGCQWIEFAYPHSGDNVALIVDEEGKLNNKIPNRALIGEDRKIYDIIVGDFLVVGLDLSAGDTCDLDENQLLKYTSRYLEPEVHLRESGELKRIPVTPTLWNIIFKGTPE